MIRSLFNSSFFRQSAWMLFATLANGALMAVVQGIAVRWLDEPVNELSIFGSLLDVLGLLSIPITGVLTVFTHQAVSTETEQERRRLVGAARGIIVGLFVLWLSIALVSLGFQSRLIQALKLPNPAIWWLTMLAGLAALLTPIFTGILQGQQKFFWVGNATMLNAVGRLAGVIVAVVGLKMAATGAIAGVLVGNVATLALVAWMTRWIWHAPSAPFDWPAWFKKVIPLTFGVAAPIYLFTQDLIVVQQFYDESAANAYAAPRVVGRILYFLVAPMTLVMFPKVARSAATAQRTNVLAQAVGATALIGASVAVACSFFPEFMLRLLKGSNGYAQTAWLIPWFAWCMLPLALSNLLVNNLLARKRFGAVPWLLAVAIGYRVTLHYTYGSYLTVILTLGAFSLLLFVVCVVFTIRQPRAGITRH